MSPEDRGEFPDLHHPPVVADDPKARNPYQQEIVAPRRRPAADPRGVLALLLCLLLVGVLVAVRPDLDEPRTVHRTAVGQWGQTEDFELRVDRVRLTHQLTRDRRSDDGPWQQAKPGEVFVVVEVSKHNRLKSRYGKAIIKLAPEREYEADTDVAPNGSTDPGFVATGAYLFRIAEADLSSATLEFSEGADLFTGPLQEVIEVDLHLDGGTAIEPSIGVEKGEVKLR